MMTWAQFVADADAADFAAQAHRVPDTAPGERALWQGVLMDTHRKYPPDHPHRAWMVEAVYPLFLGQRVVQSHNHRLPQPPDGVIVPDLVAVELMLQAVAVATDLPSVVLATKAATTSLGLEDTWPL